MAQTTLGTESVGWDFCGCDSDGDVGRTECACGCKAYKEVHDLDEGPWVHWQDRHWTLACAFNHAVETLGDIEALVGEEDPHTISQLTPEQIHGISWGRKSQQRQSVVQRKKS